MPIITMKVAKMKHKVKVKVVQFGVNSNKATTGYKLQGISLNQMVVRSWNYSTPNWIYVVLLRVRTLEGLYICKKLKYTQSCQVERGRTFERKGIRIKNEDTLRASLVQRC